MNSQQSSKSPFYVIQNFISPLMCEKVLDLVNFTTPDRDPEGRPIPMVRSCDLAEEVLFPKMSEIRADVMNHYGIGYKGTERMQFLWFPTSTKGEPGCENSEYLRKKWLRVRNRDLTAVLFLSDYQDKLPFDGDYEVYGGKLEFPQWKFGFNPERGTLVFFPSVPHFINAVSPVLAGDLFFVKIHIAASQPFLFDPKQYPGDLNSWFSHIR